MSLAAACLCVGFLLGGCYTAAVRGAYAPPTVDSVRPHNSASFGNYVWVWREIVIHPFDTYQVPCPPSHVVVGGGYEAPFNAHFSGADIATSGPNETFSAWKIATATIHTVHVKLYAVCAKT